MSHPLSRREFFEVSAGMSAMAGAASLNLEREGFSGAVQLDRVAEIRHA